MSLRPALKMNRFLCFEEIRSVPRFFGTGVPKEEVHINKVDSNKRGVIFIGYQLVILPMANAVPPRQNLIFRRNPLMLAEWLSPSGRKIPEMNWLKEKEGQSLARKTLNPIKAR